MKILVFFISILFSQFAFSYQSCTTAWDAQVCTSGGCTIVNCFNQPNSVLCESVTPVQTCTEIPENGVSYEDPTMVCVYLDGVTSCARKNTDSYIPGTWNSQTSSCSNYVSPVITSTGITCPAQADVKVPDSKVNPNPSKDDVACDPTKPIDPAHPDVGCASEQTAKKTNDLISESNSKLGSIASSNATNSGLLGSILGTLRGIASQSSTGQSDCPPPNVSAPSCPTGQVAGYYNGQFTCVSSSGISCTGDACRDVIVSNCGVSGTSGIGSGTGTGGDTGGSTEASKDLKTSTTQISSIYFSKSSGICPMPESFSILGQSYELSYQLLCDFADSMRGIVVALGAFSALLIVVTAL